MGSARGKQERSSNTTCTFLPLLLFLVSGLDSYGPIQESSPEVDETDDVFITLPRPWLSLATLLPCTGRSEATGWYQGII